MPHRGWSAERRQVDSGYRAADDDRRHDDQDCDSGAEVDLLKPGVHGRAYRRGPVATDLMTRSNHKTGPYRRLVTGLRTAGYLYGRCGAGPGTMDGMTQTPHSPAVTLSGGVAMPLVGFGTWQLRGQRGYEAVRLALETGYRHIDTATMYGNEGEVGRALTASSIDRRDVFITTKLPPRAVGRERATIAASLRALGTDHVDLWLVHWPPGGQARPEVWRELLAARDRGLARAVGVSNYSIRQVDELIDATGQAPAVNQIPWSPSRYDPRVLAASRERNVVVEGYSPLKGTNLRDRTLAEIASRHGVTPAQVVLRWHVEHGIPVIPRSSDRARIAANFDLFSFALTREEMARIDGLSRR
jgi:2,5-diketo-D-gluconate reductase A